MAKKVTPVAKDKPVGNFPPSDLDKDNELDADPNAQLSENALTFLDPDDAEEFVAGVVADAKSTQIDETNINIAVSVLKTILKIAI